MCGRFTNAVPFEVVSGRINAELKEVSYYTQPRFNIAPTQPVPCIRFSQQSQWYVELIRWGLVPAWADDTKVGYKMINARAETVDQKPAFRTSFRRRRCLVVADGWYEWQLVESAKQPYHLHFADRRPIGFAGLWDTWRKGESPLETCTIITTGACPETEGIHDRMPVLVAPKDYLAWLDPEFADEAYLKSLLVPWPHGGLVATKVSTHVNQARNEGAKCIEAIA